MLLSELIRMLSVLPPKALVYTVSSAHTGLMCVKSVGFTKKSVGWKEYENVLEIRFASIKTVSSSNSETYRIYKGEHIGLTNRELIKKIMELKKLRSKENESFFDFPVHVNMSNTLYGIKSLKMVDFFKCRFFYPKAIYIAYGNS